MAAANSVAEPSRSAAQCDVRARRRATLLAVLAAVLLAAAALALATGAMPLPLIDIALGRAADLPRMVLVEIRAPRVVLAGCTGMALAIAGAALQGLFRNPLADPGLIGVSSGAALGAVAMIVLGSAAPAVFGTHAAYALPVAAILGAMAATLFLYAFAQRYGQFSIVTIILVGIAVNALAGVGIGAFQYLGNDAQLRTLTFWMMGSFARAEWQTVLPAVALAGVAAAPVLLSSRRLDLLQLGEAEAFHLGVDVARLKRTIVLASAATVGTGVALAGMIGFVGLVAPHLVRLMVGAGHRQVLPGAALLGAALTILADLAARTIAAPAEIPVSLVTSAIGAPFFLWLIARARPR